MEIDLKLRLVVKNHSQAADGIYDIIAMDFTNNTCKIVRDGKIANITITDGDKMLKCSYITINGEYIYEGDMFKHFVVYNGNTVNESCRYAIYENGSWVDSGGSLIFPSTITTEESENYEFISGITGNIYNANQK